MSGGKVYLVGAGPGDPGLLTLRAKEVLSKADVVVFDALVHPKILDFVNAKARKIFRGSRGKKGALSQTQINELLKRLASQGKRVVRLKGGDPFVFGRGAEEIIPLAESKIDFEVVPGVTSAIAVPAYAGIPVTHRVINSSFTVVTGHEDPIKGTSQIDWAHLAKDQGTLVFLMALRSLPALVRRLIQEGKDSLTPAAVIQEGTTFRQKVVIGTLNNISSLVQKSKLRPPATVIVGPVVRLASKLQWYSNKPLWGKRILVTRNHVKGGYLSGLLSEEGAQVVEVATIELSPVTLDDRGIKILSSLGGYDWIVFTSSFGVETFMGRLKDLGKDKALLSNSKIACVGQGTARELVPYGLKAHLVPKDYKQEGLVNAFQKISLHKKKVLIIKARKGRDLLEKFFLKSRIQFDSLPVYENNLPAGTRQKMKDLFLKEGGVDILTFASSSAAEHFYSIFTGKERKKWLSSIPAAVIGPVTAATVRKWKGNIAVQPRKYNLEELVKALCRWAVKNSKV